MIKYKLKIYNLINIKINKNIKIKNDSLNKYFK